MRVFVLTLERMKARQERIAANLTELGVAFDFFKGVDASLGEHLSISRYDEAESLRIYAVPLLPGEIGCFASHHLLWQRCVESGEPIVVMEDDVTALPAFPEALAFAAGRIARHRFLRLAALHEDRPFRLLEENGPWKVVRFLRGPVGAQCYCLSPEGASALLARAQPWIEPVDAYIDAFWRHGVESKAILPFAARTLDRRKATSTVGRQHKRVQGTAKFRRERTRLFQAAARALYNFRHR